MKLCSVIIGNTLRGGSQSYNRICVLALYSLLQQTPKCDVPGMTLGSRLRGAGSGPPRPLALTAPSGFQQKPSSPATSARLSDSPVAVMPLPDQLFLAFCIVFTVENPSISAKCFFETLCVMRPRDLGNGGERTKDEIPVHPLQGAHQPAWHLSFKEEL